MIEVFNHIAFGLRAIFNYFMDNGYISEFKIIIPKAVKKAKQTYHEEELKILLKKPNLKTCNFSEYRTWVLTNYLLGTGNRLETVRNIKIQDINLYNATVLLTTTKNRKQQIVPLAQSLVTVLNEYLDYRNGEIDDYVFCNKYGEKMTKSRYGECN